MVDVSHNSVGSGSPAAGTHLWHPFADMSVVAHDEFVIDHGEGIWVFDESGNRYLDAAAGLWYCNVGHGRTEIADAVSSQMHKLESYQLFGNFTHRPGLELAERVCSIAPLGDDSAAFFTSGGSDSIDTAAKLARRYWQVKGEPDRRIIISREGAYHGVNAFGTSFSGIEANASGWGPLVSEVLQVGRDDVAALEQALEQHPGRVAAFIGEPVQGAAGVYPPSDDYWEKVQDVCRSHNVLVIADEVVTGFGRVGEWFASQRYHIGADMIVGAKGLSSGYLPIGVVIAGPRVRDMLWSAEAGVLHHGYTYSGHPTACAAALANLDIIEREGLVAHVRELEPVLSTQIHALGSHELVGATRVAGLLAGVELSESTRQADPGLAGRIAAHAKQRGVILRPLLGRTLQLSPPLIITEQELTLLTSTLRDSLDDALAYTGDASATAQAGNGQAGVSPTARS